MESNLARKIEAQELPKQTTYAPDYTDHTPLSEPRNDEVVVSKGLSSLEIKVMALLGIVLFALLLLNVHSDLKLSTSSRRVQDLTQQIEATEVEIENLDQHVQELSRYDRIHDIAQKYGLKLHEENIRNISPVE